MQNEIQTRLNTLCADYQQFKGHPFNHFYCPILFKDEPTELCRAHIVNQAFRESARRWTVQRKDVDGFYGTYFEPDFVLIQEADKSPIEALVDSTLAKKLQPRILIDGLPIGYFPVRDSLAQNFTPVQFEHDGRTSLYGLKISPQDFGDGERKLEIDTTKDLRIAAFGSLIKAAHLTLFDILGYRYALSATGYFVGHDILGSFFLQNQNLLRPDVLENARKYFNEFANMVRPIQSTSFGLQGTITDKTVFVCQGYDGPYWAWIVIVKTAQRLNAVLIPMLEQEEAAATFYRFLNNKNERLEVNRCLIEPNQWNFDKQSIKMDWPKTGIFTP